MKIAILHGSNDTYGATRVLCQEIECLVELGHEIAVFVPHDGPLAQLLAHLGERASVTVDHTLSVLRRSKPSDALRRPRLRTEVVGADLVVLWTLAMVAYAPILRRRDIRFYVSVHELLLGRLGGLVVRGFLASGRFPVCACSEATAEWLRACGVDSGRITVTSPVFSPLQAIPTRSTHDPLTIAVVGRVNGHKGHLEVARAMRSPGLRDRDWRLLLFGAPFPGQEGALDALREAIVGDDRVQYRGEAPSLASIATEIDAVACFPSKPEPYGLVPIEAWRVGARSVGFADGGASEVLPIVGGIGIPRTADPVGDIAYALLALEELVRGPAALPAPTLVNPYFAQVRRVQLLGRVLDHAHS